MSLESEDGVLGLLRLWIASMSFVKLSISRVIFFFSVENGSLSLSDFLGVVGRMVFSRVRGAMFLLPSSSDVVM